jgi:hypothetical protein
MIRNILTSKILILILCIAGFSATTKAQYLTVKFELEGYAGNTNSGLYNWNMWNYNGSSLAINDLCDVHLFNNMGGAMNIDMTYTALWNYHGYCTIEFPADLIGQEVFIGIKTRNHLYTVSSHCIKLPDCHASCNFDQSNGYCDYDFTTSQGQAYGNNMVDVSGGNGTSWAFYAGDINQDCAIDSDDYLLWDNLSNQFASGCLAAPADLNADGNVDNLDYSIMEPNIIQGITCQVPEGTCDEVAANGKKSITKSNIQVTQNNTELMVEYQNFAIGNTDMFVFDMTGKKVYQQTIDCAAENGSTIYNNKGLVAGTYIMELKNNGKRFGKIFTVK